MAITPKGPRARSCASKSVHAPFYSIRLVLPAEACFSPEHGRQQLNKKVAPGPWWLSLNVRHGPDNRGEMAKPMPHALGFRGIEWLKKPSPSVRS